MKKFILEVLHEEIIPEENMLSITGGEGEDNCGPVAVCNILTLPSCPNLSCLVNGECPTKSLVCKDKLPTCLGNYVG